MAEAAAAVAAPAAPATPAPAAEPTPAVAADPPQSLASVPAVVEPKPGEAPKAEAPKPGEAPAPLDVKTLKMPEGFKADEKVLGTFGEIMNDAKATPAERGQRLLDLYAGALKSVTDGHTKAWEDLNQQWVNEVKADPDIGGAKFEPTRQVIAKAIDTLPPERAKEFRTAMDVTGAGNHPAILRALATWAKALTEGGHVPGSPPSSAKSIKDTFFPNSPEMK